MKRGPIAWFVQNQVAATLLMVLIVASGIATIPSLKQSFFPELALDIIKIDTPYPGAVPEEVEKAVCIRIEEAVASLDGIDSINSIASEDSCGVTLALLASANVTEVLTNTKNAVDSITTFPEGVERPLVSRLTLTQPAIDLAVSGNASERTLRILGEWVRDALVELPEISNVKLAFVRPYEMSIEVSEESLRRYGLTFDNVADAVRNSSMDLPGGTLKTDGGDILLRTRGQAFSGTDFEKIVVLTRTDGSRVYLRDVASVVDGFEDISNYARFDGKPVVVVRVFRTNDEDVVAIGDAVEKFISNIGTQIPEGVTVTAWKDQSQVLRGRMSTLLKNARLGLLLILVVLCLFLKPRVAFWVSIGIPIAVVGALTTFVPAGLTVNIITLFGLILVIGLLVDDAIIVAESIHTHEEEGHDPEEAAILGTRAVSMPVIFGVLTTIATFTPLLFVPTVIGKIMYSMAAVVIACLIYSLVESQLVLPAHLASGKVRNYTAAVIFIGLVGFGGVPIAGAAFVVIAGLFILHAMKGRPIPKWTRRLGKMQNDISSSLTSFATDRYRPLLQSAIHWRYVTVALVLSTLILTIGMLAGGYIRIDFLNSIEGDSIVVELTMPQGTPEAITRRHTARIEASLEDVYSELVSRYGEQARGDLTHVMVSVGSQPFKSDARAQSPNDQTPAATGSHVGEIMVELLPVDQRLASAEEIAQIWRESVGPIPDAIELTFSSSLVTSGEAVAILLKGADSKELGQAVQSLKEEIAMLPGVFDISDSYRGGKQELELRLRNSAEPLGLTISALARQVRQAFYGEEVQKMQRERDEVKVMVRYPSEHRRSIGDLENMRIRTPDGQEVPFKVVAEVSQTRGATAISRSNRKRAINVTAKVDPAVTSSGDVVAIIVEDALPAVLARYRGISYSLSGEQEDQAKIFAGLSRAFMLALLVVYSLLAIPLRSYAQPLIIMAIIPFGLVGATIGHLIMGFHMTFLSFTGIIALAGIVINGSLVLVDAINRARDDGATLEEAIVSAGVRRFRPIVLTSFTTFVGLAPLMFAKSVEAHFLAPMAISIGYGIIFSSVLTLIAVPCGYMIGQDLFKRIGGDERLVPDARLPEIGETTDGIARHIIPEGVVLNRDSEPDDSLPQAEIRPVTRIQKSRN